MSRSITYSGIGFSPLSAIHIADLLGGVTSPRMPGKVLGHGFHARPFIQMQRDPAGLL
jgi:hypothetical protein